MARTRLEPRLRGAGDRSDRLVFSPSQPRVFAGDFRGAAAGASGPHPAAFPFQHSERRALADSQGAEASRGRSGGSGGAVPHRHDRQPSADRSRRRALVVPSISQPGAAALGGSAPGRLAAGSGHRGGSGAADAPAAPGGKRRLPRNRAGNRARRDRGAYRAPGRPPLAAFGQSLPRGLPTPPGKSHGACQHPRAPAAPFRRRGKPGHAHRRRSLRDRHRDALSHQPMTPLQVVIVDDEEPARNRLRELLGDCRGELPHSIAGEAANGVEGLQIVAAAEAEVVLVDIHMPEMSGIEFARHLQVLERPPAVIFVTAHDRYAVEAFEVNAVDYLTKPVRAVRLLAALKKAANGARLARGVLESIDPAPRRFFSIAERGRMTLVRVLDVIYLRAELKYVTVRTLTGEHLVEESLTQLEGEFSGVFVRIHRNCLVARRLIRGFERGAETEGEVGWSVVLEGLEERLPVSRRQWPQVKSLVS